MSEEDKFSLIIKMLNEQTRMIEENRKCMEEGIKSINSQMPFDHLPQHDLLRLHLAHIPAPKDHGDHHEFTESWRRNMGLITEVIVKSVGYVLVAAMGLGVIAWVAQTNNIVVSQHGQPTTQQGGQR